METKENQRKISTPLLIGGIIISLAGLLYITYLVLEIPDAIEYGAIDWYFGIIGAELLSVLALAVFTMLSAFKPSRLKYLSIPIFIGGAVTAFSLVYSLVKYGFLPAYAYYLFKNTTLVIAYILFGIYALRKNITIVFSTIFITISSVFALWFNMEEFVYAINNSIYLAAIFYYLMLIVLVIGVLFLIWACCIFYPPKTKNKDIIKKNIVLSVVLSIITLGIYAVFWVKSITEDIAKLEDSEINSSLETAMFFIIPFFALFWLHRIGKKSSKLADDADMSILYVVQGIFLLGFFSLALIQHQIHKAVGLHEKA